MTLLAPNFDSSEFDVNEQVPDAFRGNLPALAKTLQDFRDLTDTLVNGGSRVTVTSCYRDPQRNASIPRAVSDSQHLKAEASDVIFQDVGKQSVARALLAAESQGQGPDYSQFIVYLDTPHVHIGLPFTDGRQNGQKLIHFPDGHYEKVVLDDGTINPALASVSDTPPNPSSVVTTPAPVCHH